MQITKNVKIAIGLAIVLVGLYLGFMEISKKNKILDLSDTATTTGSNVSGGIEVPDGYTVEKIEDTTTENKISIPDLNRPITFSSSTSYDDSTKKIIINKILELQAELKKDPRLLSKWIDLGLYQKMTGDYVGASLSWKYVSEKSSSDYVSLGNLGDLYAYYLRDKIIAEKYYKKAIERGPTIAYLYIQLSGIYENVFKDLAKANAIIEEGLSKLPDDKGLLEAKKNLNK